MAVSNVTLCNRDLIRVLRGLPDCYHPVYAILTEDTVSVKAIYHEDKEEPARIDVSEACRKLRCRASDLMCIEWDGDLERKFDGAPWLHDIFDMICIPCELTRIVDDFGDLF